MNTEKEMQKPTNLKVGDIQIIDGVKHEIVEIGKCSCGDEIDKELFRVPCEVWTRVMGYFRPMTSFNVGKKGEFGERVYFDEKRLPVAECGC